MGRLSALGDSLGPRTVGAICFILLFPIYAVFDHFNQEGRGFIIVCISGVFIAAAYVNSRNIRSFVFVSMLSMLFIAQVAAVFFLKIPAYFPGFIMLPASIVNLLIVLAVMDRVEKWERSRSNRDD
jgi:energy-converting hydrogenase Eha subunit C